MKILGKDLSEVVNASHGMVFENLLPLQKELFTDLKNEGFKPCIEMKWMTSKLGIGVSFRNNEDYVTTHRAIRIFKKHHFQFYLGKDREGNITSINTFSQK